MMKLLHCHEISLTANKNLLKPPTKCSIAFGCNGRQQEQIILWNQFKNFVNIAELGLDVYMLGTLCLYGYIYRYIYIYNTSKIEYLGQI